MKVKLVPTASYSYGTYPFEFFNPVQSEVFPLIEKDCNVIISSPTSSGKSIAGEIIAGKYISDNQPVIYLSPLKALTEEKFSDWENDHYWSDLNKIVLTGDYKLTPEREKLLQESLLILCTYEMFSVRCRRFRFEKSSYIDDVACLIVDEGHFIGSSGRGDHLENSLVLFTKRNPRARIVLLSATVTNTEEIAEWLHSLNNKTTYIVRSEYRPCPLEIHYIPVQVKKRTWNAVSDRDSAIILEVFDLLEKYLDDQWLLFVHSKNMGYRLLKDLDEKYPAKVAFHNADLEIEKRRNIENNFKSGAIRFLIATSTLAYGLNLPSRRAVILGIHRGYERVDISDIYQECGRAGRPKYDDRGDAYIILPENDLSYMLDKLAKGFLVKSVIPESLRFHLINEIAEKRVSNPEETVSWIKRTLCYKQNLYDPKQTKVIFDIFKSKKIIRPKADVEMDWEEIDKSSNYEATYIGKLASYFYFDPLDLAAYRDNFKQLTYFNTIDSVIYKDAYAVSWALSAIPSKDEGFIPKNMKRFVNDYLNGLRRLNLPVTSDGAIAFGTVIEAWLSSRTDITKLFYSIIYPFIVDSERICSVISQINQHILNFFHPLYFKLLQRRIAHGISWEQAELTLVPGIGKVYSSLLYEEGICLSDFFSTEGLTKINGIVPPSVMKKVDKKELEKITHGWIFVDK